MKIKWLGHAAFLITAENGTRIITDPYAVGGGLSYGKIDEAADIVTISHQHFDHNNAAAVKGSPQVVMGAGIHQAKGLEFKGIASCHDDAGCSERGPNTIFCFSVDGIRVCHLGDLGQHQLSEQQAAELGAVDVMLIPVGGSFTINAATATELCERIKPGAAIPMHYRTARCSYPISGVDDFLKGKTRVRRVETSEIEFSKGTLPKVTEVVVLKHAL